MWLADKLAELVNKANDYLKWVGHSIELSDWIEATRSVMSLVGLGLAVVYILKKQLK